MKRYYTCQSCGEGFNQEDVGMVADLYCPNCEEMTECVGGTVSFERGP